MVLKKRLDHGFNGFLVNSVPRGPRSIRKRSLHKTFENGHICAIELLASLAGKLLQESESYASSNASEGNDRHAIVKDVIKQERQDVVKPLKAECIDLGNCEVSAVSEAASQNSDHKFFVNEFPIAEGDSVLKRTSILRNSDCSEKSSADVKSVVCLSKTGFGDFPNRVEEGSPEFWEPGGGNVVNEYRKRQFETEVLETGCLTMACRSNDSLELSGKVPASLNSNIDVKLPLCGNSIPKASFSRNRNDIKLGIRDDDENFSRCNKVSTKFMITRPPTRIGDRRIRKLLTSKYWKVSPKLKNRETSKADAGTKPLYCKRKTCYNRERFQQNGLYKRRKFADRNSVLNSDGAFSSESVSNSPQKGMNGDKYVSAARLHGVNGISSSVSGHQASFPSKDSPVKFSIKSFRIPELCIEVPETATVGSLKRKVMEAVTAILGGGMHIGVLIQGKKVRDDNRTLSQTGISCKDNMDTLGFSLEPSPAQAPSPLCAEDPPFLLPCDAAPQVARSPATPALDSANPDTLLDAMLLTHTGHPVESTHDLVSHPDITPDKNLTESRALVAVPAMNVEALAVVPMKQKIKRSELAQRRTRRPFSVSEVEALVHAVEELGTGRWRDVKLCAFENADHRTYVDLKDKWKTLVHTAKISPQQRRGEPVPQELLDRVLAAHDYWSLHQAKQQSKHQCGTLKISKA
ncbi:hypothetical protein CFOL_v3_18647 [Cephalotus follicularis]|uniref:Uncharacterized protein n=1 Tax=Cephalotus follicularis TaxID=3775 RepID=A0A1Q3C503_CEPFO|nr:hypothetical protein CFOL_v3_18647 [Cephalotus follicularis]